jgi:hypothetical protein
LPTVEQWVVPVQPAVAVGPAWEAHYLSTTALSQLTA